MITLLAKRWIQRDASEEQKRVIYGLICGATGTFLNLLLFGGKLLAGALSHSVSIIADAFNNLSDAGSSILTIVGFKLSAKKADSKHPYGHGRVEYLTGLIISIIVISVGVQLFCESIRKIISPVAVELPLPTVIIMLCSILVKCYMAFYNHTVGKKIQSASLKASAKDSLSDCVTTAVVLITAAVSNQTGLKLDGWAGVLVSVFIVFSGISAAKESVNPLLGSPPSAEFVNKIRETALSFNPNIVGVHDIVVHDYGLGRKIISLHTEVPDDGNFLTLHDIADNLEKELSAKYECMATIHLDPVNTRDSRVVAIRKKVAKLLAQIHPGISVHDFRVIFGDSHSKLLFDAAVPFNCKLSEEQLQAIIQQLVTKEIGSCYTAVVEIDRRDEAVS